MQDVVIERCIVHVVRRSGWSWGADPRRLLRRVTDAVPGLLAERLGAWTTEAAVSGTIAQPIALRVPIRLSEIADAAFAVPGTSPGGQAWRARLDRAIEEAVKAIAPPADAAAPAPDDAPPAASAAPAGRGFVEQLMEALAEWRASGALAAVLARLDDPHVRAWIEMLASMGTRPDASTSASSETRRADDANATEGHRLTTRIERGPAGAVRSDIRDRSYDRSGVDGVDFAAGVSPTQPVAARPLQDGLSRMKDAIDVPAEVPAPSLPVPATGASRAATRRLPQSRGIPVLDGEADVPSALPWLILGPLQQLGYLRTLDAVLDAGALAGEAPLFGAALAFKLTPSADRPWAKTAAADRLAGVMACRRVPVSKADVHQFARRAEPFCPVIDGTIVSATLAGHEPADPWIVQRVPPADGVADVVPRFCVIDPPGLFPAAWAAPAGDVVALLRERPGAGCIVPADSADAGLLAALEHGGVSFVTTARPGRGESWTRVDGPGTRTWRTNRPAAVDSALRLWLRRQDDLGPRAEALAYEFGARRVALPLDSASDLERSLALATSSALALLAWTLWHAREDTDALLMLHRFEDLDARVRFTPRAVRVVVPLGRRHRDLLEAGLLRDVVGVPWFGGRVLEFSGG